MLQNRKWNSTSSSTKHCFIEISLEKDYSITNFETKLSVEWTNPVGQLNTYSRSFNDPKDFKKIGNAFLFGAQITPIPQKHAKVTMTLEIMKWGTQKNFKRG
jgi:hypothetical protein